MSTRGVFREGRFAMCGDGLRGVPECMGRAARDCCTCPTFSAEEMRFAKEHGLTIEREGDMPIEWRARRGSGAMWATRGEAVCSFCFETGPAAMGDGVAICEPCARKALALFTKALASETGRRLRAVPSEAP